MRTVVAIPARMGSTRLPGKPLADLCGRPMILRVLDRVRLARVADEILVATDHERIAAVVRAAGGRAVMTSRDCASGSDRIWEAVAGLSADLVVNVQGDEPFLSPSLLQQVARATRAVAPVATAGAPLLDRAAPASVVRVAVDDDGLALDFARADLPGRVLQHVGIYAYRRQALAAFVALPPSAREVRARLEQLRLLDAGIGICVVETDEVPLSIDTPQDLAAARQRLASPRV